ncbi:MAG: hypothetical protein AB1734_06195 [Elusimicrobiota bacterium]
MCGSGGDPASGNFNLPYPGLKLPPGSPAPSYTPGYNSLGGGFTAGGATLEPQSDGTVLLTLPDGTRILFVPAGALAPELTGDMDQFNYPSGYNSVLGYAGGGYTLKDKDGTVTHFESVPYANVTCDGPACPSYHRVSRQVDRNGGALVYGYTKADSDGKLSRITDPHGRTIDITYNAAGKPATVADFTGRQVAYEYDAAGNLSRATDVDGAQTTYAYDALGNKTEMSYDALGHVTGTKDPLGNVTLFEYGTYGALTKART